MYICKWAMSADNMICFLMVVFGRGVQFHLTSLHMYDRGATQQTCSNVIEPKPGI